jgi:hypothetical protein
VLDQRGAVEPARLEQPQGRRGTGEHRDAVTERRRPDEEMRLSDEARREEVVPHRVFVTFSRGTEPSARD